MTTDISETGQLFREHSLQLPHSAADSILGESQVQMGPTAPVSSAIDTIIILPRLYFIPRGLEISKV